VNGAFETFSNKSVKSVLIELNVGLAECAEVMNILKNHGLNLFKREHDQMFAQGPHSNMYNHIFIVTGFFLFYWKRSQENWWMGIIDIRLN
jgi:hypothetical protein